MLKVSPEAALNYTKSSVFLMFTWPPWSDASKLEKTLFNVFSWVFIILPVLLCICLINAARHQLDNYLSFTKTVCITISCVQAIAKILVCRGQRSRLETLHWRVKDFLKNATPREREVLQRYISRCGPVHLAVNACSLSASLAMTCGPLVLPELLPTDAEYPFPVDTHPGWDFAYLHHIIVGLQCASIGCIDCQAALLIWFAGARFELLADEFESVRSLDEFNKCIKKHQILLQHTDEMVRAVRYIILVTSVMTTLSIITGGVHIVSNQPLIVKSQFFIIDCGFISILFLSSWPAENLLNMCFAVGQRAYNCPWTEESPKIGKNLRFVIERSQKGSVISVAGVLPKLSLIYYSSFLSKTFSFFTTLRIIIEKVRVED